MTTSRVAIVEDHLLLAETLADSLIREGISAFVLPAVDQGELLDALLRARPELVLLDLDLGRAGDSTPLVAPLSEAGLRVLLVTGTTDRLRLATALEQGALGYQSKASGFEALVAQTIAALACSDVLDPVDRGALLAELAAARQLEDDVEAIFQRLTDRERGTLLALGDGHSVHEIATEWVLSEATVRSHVRGLLVKLGVASQLAAVSIARRNSWLSPVSRPGSHS
jgi:two-component system nitrate/nitrite response regulator NarL